MKSFEDHPFQLAAGANQGPDDQFGCLMNVVSWMNGDTRITDQPLCTNIDLVQLCVFFNDEVLSRFGVPARRIDAGPMYPPIYANVATPEQSMRMVNIASLVMDTGIVSGAASRQWWWEAIGGDSLDFVHKLVNGSENFDQAVDRFMVEVVNSFRTQFGIGAKENAHV